jgi:hypothetical protein
MATTITGTSQIEIANVTLSETPGNVTALVLPGRPGALTVKARAVDCKFMVAPALADDDEIGSTVYFTLTAGTAYVFDVSGMSGHVFLASAGASAVVEVVWSAL